MALTSDQASMQANYSRSPPRQIDIDPRSARTVIHEVRAHRRGLSTSRANGQEAFLPDLRVGRYEGESDRKSGILPDRGTIADRRRSRIDRPSRRYEHRDSDTDSSPDYLRPSHHHRHHSHHRHRSVDDRSPRSIYAVSTTSSSHSPSRRHRHSNEVARYDPGLDVTIRNPKPPRGSRSADEHDDSDGESDYNPEEHRKLRNHAMLYTGLATLTTITAANGIYQHSKGFRSRHKAYKDSQAAHVGTSEQEEAERRKARKKKLAMDMFALGVMGIGLNNVRVGWGRSQEMKKEQTDWEKRKYDKAVRRKSRAEGRENDRDEGGYSVEEA